MGKVATEFSFSHEVFGEGFYMVEVEVKRLSNSEDSIPQGARNHANHDSTEKVRKSYKAKNFYKGDLENEKVEKITSSCNVCIYAADTSNCKCRGNWQQ